jgi:hypothetical protein
MAVLNVAGHIPERNGFISGYSITTTEQFSAGTGYKCRIYRNGVATKCVFYITNGDNFTDAAGNPAGAKRTREFNTVPNIYVEGETEPMAFPFKAGERIEVVANETMDLIDSSTGLPYVRATNIHYFWVKLHRVYDITVEETLTSLEIGGSGTNLGTTGASGGGIII